MPALAKEKSTAGAKAFIRYFVDVLNYSHKTQTTQLLKSLAASDCQACAILSQGIVNMRRHRGFQRGGGWTVLSAKELPENGDNQTFLLVQIKVDRGVTKRFHADALHQIHRGRLKYVCQLDWETASWAFKDVQPT